MTEPEHIEALSLVVVKAANTWPGTWPNPDYAPPL